MNNLTEDDIRNADPEQISEWVAELKGIVRHPTDGITLYEWAHLVPDGLKTGSWHERRQEPPPYAEEWWAAGPLLEGVGWAEQGDTTSWRCTQPMPGTEHDGTDHVWSLGGWDEWVIRTIGDEWRHHQDAIQSIAAIEDRGELSVWLDVMDMEEPMSDDYFSKCPECGSRNVQIERCPNGRTECKNCGLKRLHERWIELHQQKDTQ